MGSPGVGGSLSAASDVLLDNPTDDQVLKRDTGYWKNLADAGGAISTASDATVTSVQDNHLLQYDNATSKWVNTDPAVAVTDYAALARSGGREISSAANVVVNSRTIDLSIANVFSFTISPPSGALTFTDFTGAAGGRACSFSVYIIQDGTGGRTVNWPSSVKWPEGTVPTLSTAAGAIDLFVFESVTGGTTWFGTMAGKNFS